MRHMITEGARDNALEMFLPYFQQRGMEISISQLKKMLLTKFTQEAGIRNLSLSSNYYLLGVAKYYFNGDLTENTKLNLLYPNVKDRFIAPVCEALNNIILLLRNSYIDSVGTKWEQPEDFGRLSIQQLFKKYTKKLNKTERKPKPKEEEKPISNQAGNGYTFEVITNYEQLPKYKAFTEPGAWCITWGKQHYNSYLRIYHGHFVIFTKQGYENVPRKIGKGYTKQKPHDEYGNSMIAAIQSNNNPNLVLITSRWNHGSSYDHTEGTEADNAYTQDEFLRIIGDDGTVLERAFAIYKQMKKNGGTTQEKPDNAEIKRRKLELLRWFKYAQMRMDGGVHPKDIFHSPDGPRVQVRPLDEKSANDAKRVMGTYLLIYQAYQGGAGAVTLMDRKKIFFNDFFYLIQGNVYENPLIADSRNYVAIKAGKGLFLVFDKIRHNFLNIDGNNKFRYISPNIKFWSDFQSQPDDDKYIIVAETRSQLALINTDAMKPVKARNGSSWFEAITTANSWMTSNVGWGTDIQFPYLGVDGQCLNMVYDSAAGESYLFSTKSNSFIDTSDIPDNFLLTAGKAVLGYVVFMKQKFRNRISNDPCYMLKNLDDGQILDVNGFTQFSYVAKQMCVLQLTPYGEKRGFLYDEQTRQILTFEGQTIIVEPDTICIYETGGGFVVISLQGLRDALVYNPFSHTIRFNTEVHDYNIAYLGHSRFKSTDDEPSTMYSLPQARVEADNQQRQLESIKSHFNQLTEQINHILQEYN